MGLTSMRFKNFVWPHNPRVYTIEFQRKMAVNKVPFGRYALQSLGLTRRVMKGEGEFVGEGAYDEFKKLASVFYEDTAGVLVHPLWDTTSAWFVALSLKQEPKEDYVSYSFEFWESYDRYGGSAEKTASSGGGTAAAQVWHTVRSGETIWGIAGLFGTTADAVLALNPGLKNANLMAAGQRVRVA